MSFGNIHVRVVRFPLGFIFGGKGEAKIDPIDEYAKDRFEIREPRRGVSFVRAGREIETKDAFPRGRKAESKGLGRWPLLQGYAYHWACEIRFNPDLDEVFGIANDKQRVEPHENLWKLLASEDLDPYPLDRHLQREQAWQEKERRKRKEEFKTAAAREAEQSDEPTPAERAAAMADTIAGRRFQAPPLRQAEVKSKTEESIEQKSKELTNNGKHELPKQKREELEQALENEKKRQPYKTIPYDGDPEGPFYTPEYGPAGKVVVRINRRHPFYKAFYQELLSLPVSVGRVHPRYALDYLLIALSKGELGTDDELCALWYKEQREKVWSKELARGYKVLERTETVDEPEVEEEMPSFGQGDLFGEAQN
jgi:hypothetical protein